MNRLVRILSFTFIVLTITAIIYFWTGLFFPSDAQTLTIYTCFLLMSFSLLFVEHFFTKPTDVLATSISIILIITPIKSEFVNNPFWYWLYFGYSSIIGLLSFISILLFNPKKQIGIIPKLSSLLKTVSISIGKTKYQYFLLLILSLVSFFSSNTSRLFVLFFFSMLILIEPWKLIERLSAIRSQKTLDGIGEIFGISAKRTFLVKLFDTRPAVKLFDLVAFRYSMDNKVYKGIIVDNYMLNQEQWIKVLIDPLIMEKAKRLEQEKNYIGNIIYLITDPDAELIMSDLIGLICEESSIQKIRFIYNSRTEIKEGQLLYSYIGKTKIYYQVIQAITEMQQLEKKNETGEVICEAIQLGEWNSKNSSFSVFGWVPNINTPVYLTKETIAIEPCKSETLIGHIPNTGIPIFLNKDLALSHHLAVLGVTGTGKSVFARHLMKELLVEPDVKVICIDFTDEYKKLIDKAAYRFVVENAVEIECFKRINKIETIISIPYGKENDETKKLRQEISQFLDIEIEKFMKSDSKIGIFELPEINNSSGILEYTKLFFRSLFLTAKQKGSFGHRVSIILEEAHTVVPEFNFMGIEDKRSSSLVNSVSQIALQGRKYNIGFIVIAQRTANVSKTVLTQCNSIIAFQQFDKTSNEFLSNYFGHDVSRILPTLPPRHAISFGKAFRSNTPIVFQVPELGD